MSRITPARAPIEIPVRTRLSGQALRLVALRMALKHANAVESVDGVLSIAREFEKYLEGSDA